ncbi:DUF4365 domain-containing protein [Streptomyces antimycoticus]|uniref:DUF4365 domain-containing protein n=1 Tax=Streptomyces antimycoticus TaxID=68175 RepID=UPI002570AF58|nr:DUF4365 domain-containing protein [Streptomyces antimycoticus]WJD98279.1 DUF4365 domain-containing protein [Streptomyces antimycoticus]
MVGAVWGEGGLLGRDYDEGACKPDDGADRSHETRALLERHGHIVQEVEGGSDFGEDLYVSFVRNGRRTGDLIAVQVKGGLSFRRASGYAVSTKKHPTALMWMIVAALHLLGLGVLLIMWPILWRFAESYAAGETWMWMAVLYGFTILSSGLLLYEARLGRNPIALRVMAYGPIMSLCFVALGSEKFGLHLGEGPLRGVADSTPTLMKNLIFLTIASYVGKEIVRRRRLKAAYGERN